MRIPDQLPGRMGAVDEEHGIGGLGELDLGELIRVIRSLNGDRNAVHGHDPAVLADPHECEMPFRVGGVGVVKGQDK